MVEKEKIEEEPEEKVGEVKLVEVTATTAPAYQLPDGSIVGTEQYLAWLGEKINFISKNIG